MGLRERPAHAALPQAQTPDAALSQPETPDAACSRPRFPTLPCRRPRPPTLPAPGRDFYAFSQIEMCIVLSLVKGSRSQPLQRSRKVIPAMRAIRSSSDGHT